MFRNKEAPLIFLAAVAVVFSTGLFSLKEKQKALKNESALKLSELRVALNLLQGNFKDKEKLKGELEKRLDELTRESASMEVQITQIKKLCEESENHLMAIANEISSSQETIKDLLTQKNRLLDRISSGGAEVKALENRLDILKQTTSALERHLKKMMRISGVKPEEKLPEGGISEAEPEAEPVLLETEPAVRTPSRASGSKKVSLEGEVLIVNRDFNFIVINLGKDDGLDRGDRLAVYDGDKLLGQVFVETARDNISAASGGKDLDAYRIRPGNKVYFNG